jgi:acyl-CoA synthetase (AMP-forming)/AMP-acid ligase II
VTKYQGAVQFNTMVRHVHDIAGCAVVTDRDCFVFDDGSSRSFAETNHRVNRLADAQPRRGVRQGDRVAVLATDSGEYVEVILACMSWA